MCELLKKHHGYRAHAAQRAAEPDLYPAMLARIPMGRFGEPREIVGPALFLASDLAAYVSGQFLSVDGAVGAKFPFPMGEI